MDKLNLASHPECRSELPVRVLQFGEGNFLRGFFDWSLLRLNQQGLFNGRVAAVQPTPRGRVMPKLRAQDYLFTTVLRGQCEGKTVEQIDIVNTIACGFNPYVDTEWQQLQELACDPAVEFVVSNTTEAGIVYEEVPRPEQSAPSSFPAKLAWLLYKRYERHPEAGVNVLPCELIEDNGTQLKQLVLRHAAGWQLGAGFEAFVNERCRFLNTLVDRVVSGFPADAPQLWEKLGYEDELLACGETFMFFAIEGGPEIEELLPFRRAGLNVVIAPDITPYRLRKVRILNGAHTANVPAAYLAGLSTVDEMMTHPVIGKFARAVIYDEIIPAVNLERGMLTAFADDVVNRFLEPSMHHQLASILMNCASKIRARVLPSILDARSRGMLPKKLCFALAAFFALYHKADGQIPVKVSRAGGLSGEFNDDAGAVAALSKAWSYYTGTEASAQLTVKAILADRSLWGQDLSSDVDLMQLTAKLTHAVISDGVLDTMRDLLEHP